MADNEFERKQQQLSRNASAGGRPLPITEFPKFASLLRFRKGVTTEERLAWEALDKAIDQWRKALMIGTINASTTLNPIKDVSSEEEV